MSLSSSLFIDKYSKEFLKYPSLILREVKGCSLLSLGAKHCWELLFDLSKFDKQSRKIEISNGKLRSMLCKAKRTIQRYTKELANNGFITIKENYDKHGRLENTYIVLVPNFILENIAKKPRKPKKQYYAKSNKPLASNSEMKINSSIDNYSNDYEIDLEYFDSYKKEQALSNIEANRLSKLENSHGDKNVTAKDIGIRLSINNNSNTKNIGNNNNTVSFKALNKENSVSSLNEKRIRYIKGMIKKVEEAGVKISNPQELFDQICFQISSAFYYVGKSFKHQVNIISKLLRQGRWRTPIGFSNHSDVGQKYRAYYAEIEGKSALQRAEEHKACQAYAGITEVLANDLDSRVKAANQAEKNQKLKSLENQISNAKQKLAQANASGDKGLCEILILMIDKYHFLMQELRYAA